MVKPDPPAPTPTPPPDQAETERLLRPQPRPQVLKGPRVDAPAHEGLIAHTVLGHRVHK